jgi:beta-galactosidase
MQKGHDGSPYGNTVHSISRREFMKAMASLTASGAILSSASGDISSSNLRVNMGREYVKHLFPRAFAPSEMWAKLVEHPFRQDICLNGLWQFQPVPVPGDWSRDTGTPPALPAPSDGNWETTPIKIPSPWNVNTWGSGRDAGSGTGHPYWPSSIYFPSYPASWDGVEMGWLRRSFLVPMAWSGKRIVLHFEAVGGNAQIYVNGHMAGEYFDRYLPFDLDITDLVTRGELNELLVGIRSMRLYDQKSAKYKHMRTPYPPGSTTDNLVGIWQDVYLLALPAVHISDVFIKPFVDRNILEWDVTITNDTIHTQNLEVNGNVHPWVNLAGSSVLDAPEPKWRLDPPVLKFPIERITMKPGESRTVTLKQKVSNRLKLWTPDTPNLYGLLAAITAHGKVIDRYYTRFGWRQTQISNADFLLNGKKTVLFGDLLHPFGPFICSRRYVWSWYRMIKEMHGNAVRLHAQPHPRHYLDMADEMGLLVLDETALFGSSLQLNFEAPEAWDRFAKHYDNMILRDRNHPSVFGWSCGNELFATLFYGRFKIKGDHEIRVGRRFCHER